MAITNDNFCLTTMRELQEVSGTNGDPMRNRQMAGLLEALTSSENSVGTEVKSIYATGDGKNRKAIFKHLTPDSISDTTGTIENFCDEPGASQGYTYDEVSINQQVQSSVSVFTEEEYADLCEPGNEMRLKVIAGKMNSLRRNINRKLIPLFYSGCGGILEGNGAVGTAYNMLWRDQANYPASVNAEGQIEMMDDIMKTGLEGRPILVGGDRLNLWAKLSEISCCNQWGVNPSEMDALSFYRDLDISAIQGPSDDEAFFVFMPRAAQFIPDPMFVGEFRKIGDTFIKDTLVDPVTGQVYDFHMSYDPCGDNNRGTYKWMLSLNFGLWQMPLDLYKSSDDRYKINGNFSFQIKELVGA